MGEREGVIATYGCVSLTACVWLYKPSARAPTAQVSSVAALSSNAWRSAGKRARKPSERSRNPTHTTRNAHDERDLRRLRARVLRALDDAGQEVQHAQRPERRHQESEGEGGAE